MQPMRLRTICLRKPLARNIQTSSKGVGPGWREIEWMTRTVFLTGVPAFWKALKSRSPVRMAAASSMRAGSGAPCLAASQTKGSRWGRTKPGSSQSV